MMQDEMMHILLADDDEDDCLFFKEAFEDIKIKTNLRIVNDGVELMNYLTRTGIKLPHILFLDLNMPRKSGLDCLVEIKSMKHLRDIPIAIYSTSASEADIEDTFVKGANIYIKKPGDFGALKKTLEQIVTINWQYHTSGLNKEHFLLSI